MNLVVKNPVLALWNGMEMRCATGRNGFIAADAKREGDGKTPVGSWVMREVFYRPDRGAAPQTRLPVRATQPDDAWCDIDGDPKYNQHVKLPYPTRDERLWREDRLYDVMVVLGHNDAPVRSGLGSAIFLHVARPDFGPSTGCVTLSPEDLRRVLGEADSSSCVKVLSL